MTGTSDGQEWLSKRLDHLESDLERLRQENEKVREEFRQFRESVYSNLRQIERNTDGMPEMRTHYQRQRGLSEGFSFLSKTLIAVGATVSAIYAVWVILGDRFIN